MQSEKRHRWYLHQMGIQVWQGRNRVDVSKDADPRGNNPVDTDPVADEAIPTSPPPSVEDLDWEVLQKRVAACTACGLHKTRIQTVFGAGNHEADLVIIGEAPGANEDKQGEPFVGRAGKLLDSMLAAINLDRQQIYIVNILKCRPPNNRDPKPEEVRLCTPFLTGQLALLRPKVMLAVGRIAAHFLLNTNASLSRLRGIEHRYGEGRIPLIVTYHPAYLLRSPREKRKALHDLLTVKQLLDPR